MSTAPVATQPSRSNRIAWVLKAIQVRLRFVLVLFAAGILIGGWETWRTYWDRWVLPSGADPSLGAISMDTEYFCPMDPGVLSQWPGKCSVCNMQLVRRSKGDMTPLPTGVLARVNLAPNRIQLAGVRTSPIAFAPLEQETTFLGTVTAADKNPAITASVESLDRNLLVQGAKATITPEPADGRDPLEGHLDRIEDYGKGTEQAVIAFADPKNTLRTGDRARITLHIPITTREPFRSTPDQAPPLQPKEPRSLYLCAEHPEVAKTASGSCPKDGNALMKQPLAADQRLRWWCPMHPKVTSEVAGAKCDECGGMVLVPRAITYRPKGKVLAVPETAVIDLGSKKAVFVESMPGTFDAIEVKLGPRCGTMYPVVSGLEVGQKVATSGAFLVDAETRLNPSLAAGYFGAGASRPTATDPAKSSAKQEFEGLAAADQAIASAQKTCPVTKKKLGSMGTPVKVTVAGRSVFVCCEGCIDALKDNPSKYLKPSPAAQPHHQ